MLRFEVFENYITDELYESTMVDKKEILDRLFFIFSLTLMSIIVLSNLTGILSYDINWVLSVFQEGMVEITSEFINSLGENHQIKFSAFLKMMILTSGVTIYFFTLIFTPLLVIVFLLEKILKSSNKKVGKNT